jgi:hypothetical protein
VAYGLRVRRSNLTELRARYITVIEIRFYKFNLLKKRSVILVFDG